MPGGECGNERHLRVDSDCRARLSTRRSLGVVGLTRCSRKDVASARRPTAFDSMGELMGDREAGDVGPYLTATRIVLQGSVASEGFRGESDMLEELALEETLVFVA